jgi:hypothetical protein
MATIALCGSSPRFPGRLISPCVCRMVDFFLLAVVPNVDLIVSLVLTVTNSDPTWKFLKEPYSYRIHFNDMKNVSSAPATRLMIVGSGIVYHLNHCTEQ